MEDYKRVRFVVTEFETEDVITTSGVDIPDTPTPNSPFGLDRYEWF